MADPAQADPEVMAKIARVTGKGAEPISIHLWGDPGRGKSCIAALLYAGWQFKGPDFDAARWFRASDVVDWIIQCRMSETGSITHFYPDGSSEELTQRKIERRVQAAGLVIFDDIGTRKATEPACEVFLNLIESRAHKFTVYTGNNPPNALAGLYNARIASRINGGLVIPVTGKDRRLERAARISKN